MHPTSMAYLKRTNALLSYYCKKYFSTLKLKYEKKNQVGVVYKIHCWKFPGTYAEHTKQ